MYDDFAATFGRRHSSPEEYEHRRAVFHDNRKFIEDWNTEAHASDSHMLGLNHFADWTQVRVLLPLPVDVMLHRLLQSLRSALSAIAGKSCLTV